MRGFTCELITCTGPARVSADDPRPAPLNPDVAPGPALFAHLSHISVQHNNHRFTMSLAALVSGADCGPANPLQGLTKNLNSDRGLQQVHTTRMHISCCLEC